MVGDNGIKGILLAKTFCFKIDKYSPVMSVG